MFRTSHFLIAIVLYLGLPIAQAQTVVQGEGATFVMSYDPIYDATMQSLMNDAAAQWADLIRSEVPIEVYVDAQNLKCNFSYNSHVDSHPPQGVMNFSGAPLNDTYYPIALANALAGVDLDPQSPDIVIEFNKKMITHPICQKWDFGKDGDFSFLQFNLYFETMQEIAHGLGLIPLGNLMTGQKLNGFNDVYWTKLKSEKLNKMVSQMSAAEIIQASREAKNLAFQGEKSWEAAAHLGATRTSDALLLFSRSYDAPDLTGFHLEESTLPKQILMVDMRGEIPEMEVALAMLEDLGWPSTRNAAPTIEGQLSIQINEDTDYLLTLADLVVTDEEPALLTLVVQDGPQYTRSGNRITPYENLNGTLTVPVTVSDAEFTSETFNVEVTVTPVNDAPVVAAQASLQADEDASLTLSTSQLTIHDVDSNQFTLSVLSGSNYTVQSTTITPTADFFGSLTVPVRVNDGSANSAIFNATVTVTSVNDAPVIRAQNAVSIIEETSLTLQTSMLSIFDVDSSQFSLSVYSGAHYSVSGQTVTPNENYNGELSIPVEVSDGSLTSNRFNFVVTVLAENDPPVLHSVNTLAVDEDQTLNLALSNFNFSDIDSTEFTVVASSGNNYQVSGSQIIPDENFFGTLSVPVQISDSVELSNTLLVPITVRAVNDAPVITHIIPQSIFEDNSLFVSEHLLTVADPDDTTFTLEIGLGEHYQVAGHEIIPDPNWSGELRVPLLVNDGEADSNEVLLDLSVVEVNDLPELSTASLPNAQIYRAFSTQLNASDIDGEAITFGLANAPSWLSISMHGTLSANPNENMIGEHTFDITLSDGRSTVAESRTLTVLDDPTATDLSVGVSAERNIWSTDAWVPVEMTIKNAGPMTTTETEVVFNFSGDWTTQDARCYVQAKRCNLTVEQTATLVFSVKQTATGSADLTATVSHLGFETNSADNETTLTLTFTDGTITSPQYTVPNFGQGTVRAIGISNVQGGRWPEILFANGPTEASTAYKFAKSLFRPVLHSHLADASDSYAMALFDIDLDGDTDWVLANGNGEGNTVYLNNGEGYFELSDILGGYDSRAVAFGDVNRDGYKDLVFANNNDPNTLYLNQGNGTFKLAQEFESRRSRAVIIYDLNRDGQPDILFANWGFRNQIFFSRSRLSRSEGFARNTETSLDFDTADFGQVGDLSNEMIMADLDGDGVASDVVIVNEGDDAQAPNLQVFATDESGNTDLTSETQTGSVADISVGDYNGDGKDDVAVLRPGGALEVMSAEQNTLETIEVMDTDGADTLLLVDVDGSGQADVITANNRSDASRVDFAGEVVDEESTTAGDSVNVELPATPTSQVTVPTTQSNSKRGGAGLPILVIAVLMFVRRKAH